MVDFIENIISRIQNTPVTFVNLARTATTGVVYGPIPLGEKEATPRYAYAEELIQQVERLDYSKVAAAFAASKCGSLAGGNSRPGEGVRALPLMMRLARAGVITHAGCHDGIDTWKVTPEASKYFLFICDGARNSSHSVKEMIRLRLQPGSEDSLHGLIVKNYR